MFLSTYVLGSNGDLLIQYIIWNKSTQVSPFTWRFLNIKLMWLWDMTWVTI